MATQLRASRDSVDHLSSLVLRFWMMGPLRLAERSADGDPDVAERLPVLRERGEEAHRLLDERVGGRRTATAAGAGPFHTGDRCPTEHPPRSKRWWTWQSVRCDSPRSPRSPFVPMTRPPRRGPMFPSLTHRSRASVRSRSSRASGSSQALPLMVVGSSGGFERWGRSSSPARPTLDRAAGGPRPPQGGTCVQRDPLVVSALAGSHDLAEQTRHLSDVATSDTHGPALFDAAPGCTKAQAAMGCLGGAWPSS